MREVRREDERRDAERLTEVESTAEVVEVRLPRFALREQQATLVRGRDERHLAVGERL
ncbi:MAG: hypothetical protein RLZZ386_1545, partial [Planctomycetota bacterium]